MKTIQTYIAGIVSIGIIFGFTSSYAVGSEYTKASNIGDLCEIAFKGEINYDGKGCVFNETFSDNELLGDINFTIKGKVYTSIQLKSLLDTAIIKKYEKLGYKKGTTGIIKAKSRFYDALLAKIGDDFSTTNIQNNSEKRELYSGLYLIISVSKFRNTSEYIASITKSEESSNTSNVYQENHNPSLSQEGFLSTGINQADIERIEQARASIEDKAYNDLSTYEKQLKGYTTPKYAISSPNYNVEETGLEGFKKAFDRISEGPKLTGFIGNQNGEIYKHIVDDTNIYIGTLIDGGLVNYPTELVKETGFFRTYVGPFYGDSDGQWRNGTTNGQNAEKVLGYFGYSIDLDPLSPTYLGLSYNETKNQARGQIDYIDNIWK